MEGTEIVVSAPGKVILHGEHAVVYGKTALAAGLNLRTCLRLQSTDDDRVTLDLPDIGVKRSWSVKEIEDTAPLPYSEAKVPGPPSENLEKILKQFAEVDASSDTKSLAIVSFLYLYGSLAASNGSIPSVKICINSELPVSAGLGSSAAYSVCLASSLLLFTNLVSEPKRKYKKKLLNRPGDVGLAVDVIEPDGQFSQWLTEDLDLINKWAFQAEKIIHGKPSGIDNSVSTYGGALCFQKGKITPLNRVPNLNILLINTKVPRSTKTLVANVGVKYQKYPEIIGPVLDCIEAITHKCRDVLTDMASHDKQEHYQTLQDLVNINQQQLQAIGVSHQTLETICQTTLKYGLHSKLTGAGGGGCAFSIIPPGMDNTVFAQLQSDLKDLGFDSWQTSVGGDGVIQHSTSPLKH